MTKHIYLPFWFEADSRHRHCVRSIQVLILILLIISNFDTLVLQHLKGDPLHEQITERGGNDVLASIHSFLHEQFLVVPEFLLERSLVSRAFGNTNLLQQVLHF